MKQIIIGLFLVGILSSVAKAQVDNCKPKTCDEQLADAKKEIARLKKQVKSLSNKPAEVVTKVETVIVKEKTEVHKNILSLYAVNSQRGLDTDINGSTISVSTKSRTGIGLMYQRMVDKSIYLGFGLDTNRSGSVNIGKGF